MFPKSDPFTMAARLASSRQRNPLTPGGGRRGGMGTSLEFPNQDDENPDIDELSLEESRRRAGDYQNMDFTGGGFGGGGGDLDMSELEATYAAIPGLFNVRKYMKSFNELGKSVKESGFAQATNARDSYTNNMIALGLNPASAGVIEAQARMPVYGALKEITNAKEGVRLQANTNRANTQAGVAEALAQIRASYAASLMDFNIREMQINMQQQMMDRGSSAGIGLLGSRSSAAAPAPSTSAAMSFSPGYIPNQGPVQGGYGFPSTLGYSSPYPNVFAGTNLKDNNSSIIEYLRKMGYIG